MLTQLMLNVCIIDKTTVMIIWGLLTKIKKVGKEISHLLARTIQLGGCILSNCNDTLYKDVFLNQTINYILQTGPKIGKIVYYIQSTLEGAVQ